MKINDKVLITGEKFHGEIGTIVKIQPQFNYGYWVRIDSRKKMVSQLSTFCYHHTELKKI